MKHGDKFLLHYDEEKKAIVDESGEIAVITCVVDPSTWSCADTDTIDESGYVVNGWTKTLNDIQPYSEKEFDGVPTKDYERLKQENATLHDDMDSMGETIRIQGIRIQEVENELRVEQSKCISPSVDVIRENEIKYITLENLILKGLKS